MSLPVLLAALLAAPQSGDGVILVGAGRNSCALAWTLAKHGESFAWVMGYWSGKNVALDADVGRGSDGWGIAGEIKLLCEANPSMSLSDATDAVYQRMAAKRRAGL